MILLAGNHSQSGALRKEDVCDALGPHFLLMFLLEQGERNKNWRKGVAKADKTPAHPSPTASSEA